MNSIPAGNPIASIRFSPSLLRGLVLPLALAASPLARAIVIEEEIPGNTITASASSEYGGGQAARHLVDGSGMQNGLHDNDRSANTMWHTTRNPAPTSAATGLPDSPAWVRFDFVQPQKFDSISIWNHNQPNLTNRGFRLTRIFGSSDGATWFPLTSRKVITLPRAEGSPGLEPFTIANAQKSRALKSVVIAAETTDGNYGADDYGLSAMRFSAGREVTEAELPVAKDMTCAALPYAPYRRDGKPGRQIAVSLRDVKLYGPMSIDTECAGARELTELPANPHGVSQFRVFLPATVNPTNAYDAIVTLEETGAPAGNPVILPAYEVETLRAELK